MRSEPSEVQGRSAHFGRVRRPKEAPSREPHHPRESAHLPSHPPGDGVLRSTRRPFALSIFSTLSWDSASRWGRCRQLRAPAPRGRGLARSPRLPRQVTRRMATRPTAAVWISYLQVVQPAVPVPTASSRQASRLRRRADPRRHVPLDESPHRPSPGATTQGLVAPPPRTTHSTTCDPTAPAARVTGAARGQTGPRGRSIRAATLGSPPAGYVRPPR